MACFGKRDLALPQPIGQFQLRQHPLALAVAERVGLLLRGAGGHDDHAVMDLAGRLSVGDLGSEFAHVPADLGDARLQVDGDPRMGLRALDGLGQQRLHVVAVQRAVDLADSCRPGGRSFRPGGRGSPARPGPGRPSCRRCRRRPPGPRCSPARWLPARARGRPPGPSPCGPGRSPSRSPRPGCPSGPRSIDRGCWPSPAGRD